MRKLLLLSLLVSFNVLSQNSWINSYSKRKVFVENLGQFDQFENKAFGKIEYAIDFGSTRIFFAEKGITYSFLETKKIPRSEREKLANDLANNTYADHKQWERVVGKFEFRSDEINMSWNSDSKCELIGKELTSDYHSYTFQTTDKQYKNLNHVKGFEKIVYKNVYPKIDIEFTVHPEIGVKYAIILHPGANPDQIKMLYDRDISLENGAVHIPTLFGDIIDHEPYTFTQGNKQKTIPSSFVQHGKEIHFKLGEYSKKETIVIDPWTQTPSFATNWDCVWECERDGAGNVYIMGGVMPVQVIKYNSAGTLQWTYNTPYDTSNVWLGTIATDLNGNTYATAGSTAQIQKINTSGSLVWNNASPGGALSNAEFWTITFNCDQSKLIVGGTGGSAFSLLATMYEININTGAVLTSQNFATGNTTSIPPTVQEVRAVHASPNGKYYFMTHDTLGAFNQNFNLCGNSSLIFKVPNSYNFSYKCENYRYDNSGICALRANNSFFYTQNGTNVHKRSLQTGAILATATIPGGNATTSLGDYVVSNSGLDLDDCGNVFVGSSTGVVKYDANLTQLATYTTSFKVYDVHVNSGGEIIVCGSTGTSSTSSRTGYVQTFTAGACSPLAANCCDATICPVQNLCSTDAPVTLTAATAGGTWSGPGMSSNGTFNPATAGPGTHTITYTLPCGSETATIIVSPCQALTVCVESNGTLTVSNGVGPYTWAYYTAATSTPITNQAQCTACGYTWLFTQCVNGVTPVTSCATAASWTNFATGTTVTPSSTLPIKVTDNSGTSLTINAISSLPSCNTNPCPTITVNFSNVHAITCHGLTNGTATVSATGGTSPYTYSWSPGNLTGATQTALAAGTYTIIATDNAQCTGTTTITITEPTAITLTSSGITPANCGSTNGAATVNGSGGTGTLTYSWSPSGGNASSASNLAGGNYVVTVQDANLCTQTINVTIPSAGGPTITNTTTVDVNCQNPNSGQVTITASGGNGTLTYQLDNGTAQTLNVFSGLATGTYTVTVNDANNCPNSTTITINAATPIQLTQGTIVNADCGSSNGSATVNVANGSGNYTYFWSPSGGTNATASNIAAGAYTVSVTDQTSSCTATLDFTISANGGPSIINVNTTQPSCFNSTDGSIMITANGGASPYMYALGTGTPQTSNILTNVAPGTYQITVFDANNCPATQNVTVSSPPVVTANAGNAVSICVGQSTVLTANGSGGTGTLSYAWSNNLPGTNPSVSPTATTTYTLTVTDANGCSTTSNIVVTVVPSPVADASPLTLSGNAPLSVSFTNTSTNATQYAWDFGNGQTQVSTNTNSINMVYNSVGAYEVVLVASNGICTDTWNGEIIVIPFGVLTYEIPNVFSPNGDNINDVYGITSLNAASLEAIIVDRWGIKMAELNAPNATWDGKSNGINAVEGVYFLRYKITGIDGTEKIGHTFFHLVH